jgi:hypothetical protein
MRKLYYDAGEEAAHRKRPRKQETLWYIACVQGKPGVSRAWNLRRSQRTRVALVVGVNRTTAVGLYVEKIGGLPLGETLVVRPARCGEAERLAGVLRFGQTYLA